MEQAVYLDHNATTPVCDEARRAVGAALATVGNPSSVHRFGRIARRILDEARDEVAVLAGAEPEAVIFTSGGTEANARGLAAGRGARVLVSAVEHASVHEAVPEAEPVAVDAEGRVDLADLERRLAEGPPPAVVAVMLANNETGVIQPVVAVSDLARRYGARVHCDAVQAAGKIPLDAAGLGVDTLALSGHKFGAPMGTGALVDRSGAVRPILHGGGQERRRRAGTENLPGLAGFGAAAAVAARRDHAARLAQLRDQLEADIRDAVPAVRVFGDGAPRLPNTSCFGLPGVPAETMVIALDLAGVAVGAGAACSSGKVAVSPVLTAMGVPAGLAATAIRVSLGWTTTGADVHRFLEAWTAMVRRRGAGRPSLASPRGSMA